jgi:hypothetical protein
MEGTGSTKLNNISLGNVSKMKLKTKAFQKNCVCDDLQTQYVFTVG